MEKGGVGTAAGGAVCVLCAVVVGWGLLKSSLSLVSSSLCSWLQGPEQQTVKRGSWELR